MSIQEIISGIISLLTIASVIFVIFILAGQLAKKLIYKYNNPRWLVIYNLIIASPVALSPFILLFSIFILDNPDSEKYLLFFALNSYAPVLAGSAWLSFKLYKKGYKTLSVILPVMFSVVIYGIIGVLLSRF